MKLITSNVNNTTVLNLKGQWVTKPVMERLKAVENARGFNARWMMEFKEAGMFDNEVFIRFNGRPTDIVEVVDYFQVVLNPVIGTAFTEIRVNPYKNPMNQDTGGLDLVRMIAEDTGCDVDFGEWNGCCILKPSTSTQYNEIVELLNTFEMQYN